jgi:hypothetical protein
MAFRQHMSGGRVPNGWNNLHDSFKSTPAFAAFTIWVGPRLDSPQAGPVNDAALVFARRRQFK